MKGNLFPQIRQTEKDVTKEIRAYLRMRGIWHWKVWQGLGSQEGVSDLVGCYNGKMVAIEVKGPKGILSDKQKAFLDRVKDEGGIAFVARSVEDVMTNLEGGIHERSQMPKV